MVRDKIEVTCAMLLQVRKPDPLVANIDRIEALIATVAHRPSISAASMPYQSPETDALLAAGLSSSSSPRQLFAAMNKSNLLSLEVSPNGLCIHATI